MAQLQEILLLGPIKEQSPFLCDITQRMPNSAICLTIHEHNTIPQEECSLCKIVEMEDGGNRRLVFGCLTRAEDCSGGSLEDKGIMM
jgi:hypothetical protein